MRPRPCYFCITSRARRYVTSSASIRKAPVGHFFDVMTNGYGSMPDYKQQVPVRDRWAIAAYIRALQLSQHFPRSELTAEMKRKWDEQKKKGVAGAEAAQ